VVAAPDGGKRERRVAIACQGGGSHTAFTAGVLKRLPGADELSGYEVVGLSGTSGGAVCALLAWYALLDEDRARAGQLLEQFWIDNSAREPAEMLVNNWMLWASSWQDFGIVPPAVSPYHSPASVMGADYFRQMLSRQVDFNRIEVDLTHKQVARERVTWTVRARDGLQGTDLYGQVEAEFRSGKVAALRLGPSC
jgi:NTE family protein